MITHDGKGIPAFEQGWDTSDQEWLWVSWASVLDGESISTSVWTLPTGWTNEDALVNQTVVEDGVSYTNSNGVLLSTTASPGLYEIANKVTLSDGRVYERSVRVHLQEL